MKAVKLAIIIVVVLISAYAMIIIHYMHNAISETLARVHRSHNYPPQLEFIYGGVERVTNILFNVLYILIIVYAIIYAIICILWELFEKTS